MTQASSGCGPALIDAASPSERASERASVRACVRVARTGDLHTHVFHRRRSHDEQSRVASDPSGSRETRSFFLSLSSPAATSVKRHRHRRRRIAARRSAASGRFAIAGGAKARDRFVTICRYAGIPLSAPLIADGQRWLAGWLAGSGLMIQRGPDGDSVINTAKCERRRGGARTTFFSFFGADRDRIESAESRGGCSVSPGFPRRRSEASGNPGPPLTSGDSRSGNREREDPSLPFFRSASRVATLPFPPSRRHRNDVCCRFNAKMTSSTTTFNAETGVSSLPGQAIRVSRRREAAGNEASPGPHSPLREIE